MIDTVRKQREVQYCGEELAEAASQVPDDAADSLVAVLSQEDQTIVQLRYYGGYDSKEIGAMLRMPASTVRYRLPKAIGIMKKQGGNVR